MVSAWLTFCYSSVVVEKALSVILTPYSSVSFKLVREVCHVLPWTDNCSQTANTFSEKVTDYHASRPDHICMRQLIESWHQFLRQQSHLSKSSMVVGASIGFAYIRSKPEIKNGSINGARYWCYRDNRVEEQTNVLATWMLVSEWVLFLLLLLLILEFKSLKRYVKARMENSCLITDRMLRIKFAVCMRYLSFQNTSTSY